ncbi:hypothetical protein [Roseivirga seohaensis]|uniref:hypothetical protein n=1 Tax=Roseivirga seohaensis TaxID=1914963 RepID=UPI003BA9DB2E
MRSVRISKEVVTIPHQAQQATSILQFVTAEKKRRMKQPYWLAKINPDGHDGKPERLFDFQFIHETTDVKELTAQIEYGIVYTLPIFIELATQYFPEAFETVTQ